MKAIITSKPKWNPKQKRWRIRVSKDGEIRAFYSSKEGKAGERECITKAYKWLNSDVIESKILVKDFSLKYLKWKSDRVGTSRINNLSAYFNKIINKHIGKKRVSKLTEQDLQRVLDKMMKQGYSYSYTVQLKNALEEFIKFARKTGITDLRPEFLEVLHKDRKEDRGTFTEDDMRTLFSEDTISYYGKEVRDIFIYSYRFLALSGLRRGEMLGLKWKDIQEIPTISENGIEILKTIHVERAINEYKETTRGKTDNTEREIPITSALIKVLESQKELMSEYGIKSDYIFCDRYGETPHPNYYSQRFKKYCETYNLSRHKVHELRHTFISFNKDTMTLSQLKNCVGHSPKMETIATYGHALKSDLTVIKNELENSKLNEIFKQNAVVF